MTEQVLADIDEQLTIVSGRRAPFTMVPEWVTVHQELQPQAKALYEALAMHVNIGRNDSKVWPTRLALSDMLGWSREQSVDPYIKQLSKVGAITVEEDRRPDGSLNRRPDGSVKKIYYVHQTEPDWHKGPRNLAEFYALHREKVKAAKAAKAAKKAAPARTRKAAPQPEPAPLPQEQDAPATPPKPKTEAPLTVPEPVAATKPKAKSRKKEKTPEEAHLDQLADDGAHRWWDVEAPKLVAQKKMTSFMGNSSNAFLAVRTLIRQALAAKPDPYEPHQIMAALINAAVWSPHRTQFDQALRRVSGVQAPSRTGPTRLYQDSQWAQQKPAEGVAPPPQPPVPPADEFAVLDDDDR